MIEEIHAVLDRVMGERGLDRRTCFVEVRAAAPEGRRIVVESSDIEVLSDTERRLAAMAIPPEARIDFVALPQGGDAFPDVLVASGSVADVRRSPSHAAELVTQLVCGDRVTPLKTSGDWVLVRIEDPYIGWVRSWHLKGLGRSEHDGFVAAARHRVAEHVVRVREEPEESARALGEAVIGTPIIAAAGPRRGWRRVELPDGCRGSVRSRSVERIPRAGGAKREKLAATAMSFLGIPYVWGGTTPKGFDCSGLVQRVFRLHGVAIPRDSDQQARAGRDRVTGRPAELRAADLLFFGKSVKQITHVAMYVSDGIFVHAHGQVRINSLLPTHPLFDERLASEWRATRDLLSP